MGLSKVISTATLIGVISSYEYNCPKYNLSYQVP